ncbi:hypothetical protein CPB86DRAFT_140199 [Serendipita vermifera]|nr:hypothetical protein CPB86DRAFT_140199 [Serendipita vermifera]
MILVDLSIQDVLSFVFSCQSLFIRFGNADFLSSVLRSQLVRLLSDIYWFMPVLDLPGEVEKFCKACHESISRPGGSDDGKEESGNQTKAESTDLSIVFDRNFPLFDFIRNNWFTDSMRNRRRLWRITQRFRQEWYKYWTEGYEYGIFKYGVDRYQSGSTKEESTDEESANEESADEGSKVEVSNDEV